MKINEKLKKGYLLYINPNEKTRQRRYEQKLNENNQYVVQCWENKSRFYYLCFRVTCFLTGQYNTKGHGTITDVVE